MIPLNVINRNGDSAPFDQSILRRKMCLCYVRGEYGYTTMPPRFILNEADMIRVDGLLAFVMIRLVLQSSQTVHACEIEAVVDTVMMMMDDNADFRDVLMYRRRAQAGDYTEPGESGMVLHTNVLAFDPDDGLEMIPDSVSEVRLPEDES